MIAVGGTVGLAEGIIDGKYVLFCSNLGKIYGRCELAQEMVNIHGFARQTIGEWICLVEHESSYNTRATNINVDNSEDFGLFMVSLQSCICC